MVRMIEFSSEKVSGNSYEALLLVLFLLMFALTARWELPTRTCTLECRSFEDDLVAKPLG